MHPVSTGCTPKGSYNICLQESTAAQGGGMEGPAQVADANIWRFPLCFFSQRLQLLEVLNAVFALRLKHLEHLEHLGP